MKRLVNIGITAIILYLVYSVAMQVWKAMEFDSSVSGYVQNAVGASPYEIRARVLELVAEYDVSMIEGSLVVVPVKKGHEVQLKYAVPLGIGGFTYVWEKSVVARTRFGGLAEIFSDPAEIV